MTKKTTYRTYSYPATKKPALGTITFTQKPQIKAQIAPTVKSNGKIISVPFNRLA